MIAIYERDESCTKKYKSQIKLLTYYSTKGKKIEFHKFAGLGRVKTGKAVDLHEDSITTLKGRLKLPPTTAMIFKSDKGKAYVGRENGENKLLGKEWVFNYEDGCQCHDIHNINKKCATGENGHNILNDLV